MQYGILKDGTFVITQSIEDVNNVDKIFVSKAEYLAAGGTIPFTMMDEKEQEVYFAELAKQNEAK